MAANDNVESMFYVRKAPWHGLGVRVSKALSSAEALKMAGLDWEVQQREIVTIEGIGISGYLANVRSSDNKVLGVVSDRYKVLQNEEAFAFTDELLGAGVRYETAGSLAEGKRVWMLAKLPNEYIVKGDRISPFLVFANSHDGSASIKIAVTALRVICGNTLTLALNTAQRSWSTKHTGDIQGRMEEARETLFRAEEYMDCLGNELERLHRIKIPRKQAEEGIKQILPIPETATPQQEKNVKTQRQDVMLRYLYAPDLKNLPDTAFKFVNAFSDHANHAKPLRETATYQENLFAKTIDNNPIIDKAYRFALQAA